MSGVYVQAFVSAYYFESGGSIHALLCRNRNQSFRSLQELLLVFKRDFQQATNNLFFTVFLKLQVCNVLKTCCIVLVNRLNIANLEQQVHCQLLLAWPASRNSILM